MSAVKHFWGLSLGAVVVLGSSGCIDHAVPYATFTNYTDESVTVTIEGTDEVHVLEPNSGLHGEESRCVGSGLLLTRTDGTVVAQFDGETCPSTNLVVNADWTLSTSEDMTTRSPAPAPSP